MNLLNKLVHREATYSDAIGWIEETSYMHCEADTIEKQMECAAYEATLPDFWCKHCDSGRSDECSFKETGR